MADITKVGFALCYLKLENQDNFDNITRHKVEKGVRSLMVGETGVEVRRNIAEIQKAVAAAVVDGGSSHQHLYTFLDEIVNS